MNFLARQELYSNCHDELVLEEFFEGKTFLESLGNIPYEILETEQKSKVDKLLKDTDFNVTVMLYLLKDDYYLKKRFKIKSKIIRLTNRNMDYLIQKHYDLIDNYSRLLKEIIYLIETKNKRTMNDVAMAYCLGFLTFVVMLNDLGKDDFYMLNKGKYTDSDLKSFKQLKNSVRAYELSLIQKNRVYKSRNSNAKET